MKTETTSSDLVQAICMDYMVSPAVAEGALLYLWDEASDSLKQMALGLVPRTPAVTTHGNPATAFRDPERPMEVWLIEDNTGHIARHSIEGPYLFLDYEAGMAAIEKIPFYEQCVLTQCRISPANIRPVLDYAMREVDHLPVPRGAITLLQFRQQAGYTVEKGDGHHD